MSKTGWIKDMRYPKSSEKAIHSKAAGLVELIRGFQIGLERPAILGMKQHRVRCHRGRKHLHLQADQRFMGTTRLQFIARSMMSLTEYERQEWITCITKSHLMVRLR